MAGDDEDRSLGASISDLNIALEEAVWVACRFSEPRRAIRATFDALTLPADGTTGLRRIVTLEFGGVTRVAATLKEHRGRRSDDVIVPVEIADLESIVAWCDQGTMYGSDFFDPSDQLWSSFSNRWSVDEQWADGQVGAHVVEFFAESFHDDLGRSVLLRFWFGDLIVDDADGAVIDTAEFAADGRRWWDGLHSGDPRTSGFGIYSMSPDAIRADE